MFSDAVYLTKNTRDFAARIVAQADLVPYVPLDSSSESTFERYFNGLSFERALNVYLTFVLKGLEMPDFMLDNSLLSRVRVAFRPLYLNPIKFKLVSNAVESTMYLDFRQFKALRQLYHEAPVDRCAPMIMSPPEYWYLYCLLSTRSPEMIPSTYDSSPVFAIDGGEPRYSVLNESLVAFKSDTCPHPLSYNTLLPGSGPFTTIAHKGSEKHMPFLLELPRFTPSLELVSSWPQYWMMLKSLRGVNTIAARVGTVLETIIGVRGRNTCVLPIVATQNGVNSEYATDLRNDEKLFADTPDFDFADQERPGALCEGIVNAACAFKPPASVVSDITLETRPCPSMTCCDDMMESRLIDAMGVTSWPVIFDGKNMIVPYLGSALTFEDVIDKQTFQSEYMGDESLSSNYRADYTVEIDVFVTHALWEDYLRVDSIVAKYATRSLYDQQVRPQEELKFEKDQMIAASFLTPTGKAVKVPFTFSKFAWLLVHWGYVDLVCGYYPVGQRHGKPGVAILEIGAAPYGAMAAAVESGLTEVFHYTRFAGEFSSDPMYHGRVSDYLLELGSPRSDLRSIAKRVAKLKASRSTGMSSFSLIIVDVPLHRNNNMGLGGKNLGKIENARSLTEFVDDLPLGKSKALENHIADVTMLVDNVLAIGGDLILKVQECWDRRPVLMLFNLSTRFRRCEAVRNPFSKPSSKEVYFRFSSKLAKPSSDTNVGDKYTLEDFLVFIIRLNNHAVALLTANLIALSDNYGRKSKVIRQLSCRKKLYGLDADVKMPVDTLHVDRFLRRHYRVPIVRGVLPYGEKRAPMRLKEKSVLIDESNFVSEVDFVRVEADIIDALLRSVGINYGRDKIYVTYLMWGTKTLRYILRYYGDEENGNLPNKVLRIIQLADLGLTFSAALIAENQKNI